jgi:hypothetical protein
VDISTNSAFVIDAAPRADLPVRQLAFAKRHDGGKHP